MGSSNKALLFIVVVFGCYELLMKHAVCEVHKEGAGNSSSREACLKTQMR